MSPELPRVLREFVAETAAARPPMSDGMRSDLRLIIWGSQPESAAPGPAEAA